MSTRRFVSVHLTLTEVCQSAEVDTQFVEALVAEGAIEPEGSSTREWRFDERAAVLLHKAARLKRDLDINPAGIALALELIAEIDELKRRMGP